MGKSYTTQPLAPFQYMTLLMEWIEELINDEKVFPSNPGRVVGMAVMDEQN